MTTAVLRLSGVGKRYDTVTAVENVDLELRDGEFVSFLGPSGSGKTTTLMMVAGLQPPTTGTIWLRGQEISKLPPYRRDIGMVFQHYALFPHMSVAKNVAFPLEMRRVTRSEIRRRVDEALDRVSLRQYGNRLPTQLSGGQQQRVALARALVYKPPLLLLDEPLGALDKQLRQQMQLEISRLHRELGTAMLYVTHDQEEALVMSDRIVVFRQGRIEQIGTPVELYERPATRFVAGFLGESSFIAGRVTATDGATATLETAAGPLHGWCGPGVTSGSAAVLSVRPEHITLNQGPSAASNAVGGTITDFAYHGQHCKLIVRLGDGTEVTAQIPAVYAGASDYAPGQPATLTWPIQHGGILPTEPESPT